MSDYLNENLPDDTQFVILMTDYCYPTGTYIPRQDCPDWEGWGGVAGEGVGYPATRPFNESEHIRTKITATRWPRSWVQYYLDLNFEFLWESVDIANGIINNMAGQVQLEPPYDLDSYDEMPKFEALSFTGSIHIAVDKKEQGVRLETFHYADTPDPRMHFRNSVMVAKFTGIMPETGVLVNLYHTAADCYVPLCIRDGKEAWVDANEVEYFPSLGMVTVKDKPLILRQEPSAGASEIGRVDAGAQVEINRYHPSGYDVWGRVADNPGWIPLRYQPTSGTQAYIEPTSWKLKTVPGCKPWRDSIPGELGYISPFADDMTPPVSGAPKYNAEMVTDATGIKKVTIKART